MLEHKTVKFEVKEVDEETGIFTAHAATFSDKPDSWGDIIDKGAFKKTLKDAKDRVKILWNHHIGEPIGKPLELEEDDTGLFVKGKLSLGVQRAREILSLMKDGVITEMSIGYDTMKETWENGIRHLQEIKLWDVSPVTFAANPSAQIISVKKATSFSNMPLADRDKAWDATACEKRVRAWAGGDDNMNWNKYSQAFFWYDAGDAELLGSYKLGFADIISNRLTAIPKGVFAVAGVMMGARGGVNIPEADEAGVKAHAEKYYKKMRKEFDDEDIIAPWNKSVEIDEAKKKVNVGDMVVTVTVEGDKSGRVLSASNLEKVRKGLESLRAGLEHIESLLDAAESEPEPAKADQLTVEAAEEVERIKALVGGLKARNEGFDAKKADARIEGYLSKIKEM